MTNIVPTKIIIGHLNNAILWLVNSNNTLLWLVNSNNTLLWLVNSNKTLLWLVSSTWLAQYESCSHPPSTTELLLCESVLPGYHDLPCCCCTRPVLTRCPVIGWFVTLPSCHWFSHTWVLFVVIRASSSSFSFRSNMFTIPSVDPVASSVFLSGLKQEDI